MTHRPLQTGDHVTAVGHLDLSQKEPVLFATAPHPPEEGAGINRNYPSVGLEDPAALLQAFSHGSIVKVDGVWRGGRIDVARVTDSTRPTEPTTSLRGLLEPHTPQDGWPPRADRNDKFLEDRIAELCEDGSVLLRVDIPVRTRTNLRTVCTFILVSEQQRARRILSPVGTNSVHVRQSSFTTAQIDEVQNSLGKAQWPFYAAGQGLGPHGDMEIKIFVPYLTADILQWAESAPSGLVVLRPWVGVNT